MARQLGPIVQQHFSGVSVAMEPEAFDDLIAAHGVELVHWRAMRNPAGMEDRFDSRRPGEDHVAASNGYVFTKAGCFTGALLSNSKELRAATGGVLTSAVAQLTAPRFYDCGPGDRAHRVRLHPNDRLYLKERSILVPHQQLAQVSQTLVDRLAFPAVEVEDVMDADGTRYDWGTDFELTEAGDLRWLRPPPSGPDGAGKVYGVRYLIRPFWYVERLVHEIRVAQHEVAGQRVLEPMSQLAFVQREFVHRVEDQDPDAPNPNSPRQAPAPEDGGFGAR